MNLSCPAFTPATRLVLAPRIFLLEDKPEFFLEVAQSHHQECERLGFRSSLVLRQQHLVAHLRNGALPKTFIALRGDEFIGCVSLTNCDTGSGLVSLNPSQRHAVQLSNLFVAEQHRMQGIGTLLIDVAKQYAQDLNLPELWLSATNCTSYYQKRGWTKVRRARIAAQDIDVLHIAL